jgi:serine/threonine protein kinase
VIDIEPRNHPAHEMSWCFDPGAEITPQHRAIALLGDGIRTETWLAWDTLRWAPVVVKIARPDHVASSSTIDALRREAHAHAMITHPLVRQLFDDQTEAAAPHLVLEYVQGPALADLVVDRAVHPVDVIRLGLQIASVLRYFHACGLVHLDVKPGNAVLRAGHSVLIDLGFTRPMGWTALDGIPRGSRPYMAPEQCRCEPLTQATDLFGLGATLFELATMKPPFSCQEDGFEQLDRRATAPSELGAALPEDVDALIVALLAPEPADRPSSIDEVLRVLDDALPPNHDHVWPEFASRYLAPQRSDSPV